MPVETTHEINIQKRASNRQNKMIPLSYKQNSQDKIIMSKPMSLPLFLLMLISLCTLILIMLTILVLHSRVRLR